MFWGDLGVGEAAGKAPSPRPSPARGEGAWDGDVVGAYIDSILGVGEGWGKGEVSVNFRLIEEAG